MKASPILAFLCALAALMALSCSSATSDGGSPPKVATATDLLASIPSFDNLLPKSLQAGKAGSAKALGKAVGDVTTLDPAKLTGVTADGYKNLNSSIASSPAKMIIALLKLAVDGKDVALDKDYRVGVVAIPADSGIDTPDHSSSMDLGVIRISKPGTDVTEARWFIKVSMPTGGAPVEVPYYIFVRIVGNDPATMKVNFAIKASGTIPGLGPMEISQVCSYDAATKALTSVALPGAMTGDGSVQKLTTSGGFVTYYDISSTYKSVAYANDTEGGVVSDSKWNGGENIWTEFYNGSGDLVMNQYGSADNSNMQWATGLIDAGSVNIRTLLGLSTKPTSLYKKTVVAWDGTYYTRTISWSSDNSNWTQESSVTWASNGTWPSYSFENPVWRAGATAAAGDSIYYYSSGSWSSAYNPGTWSSTSTDTYQIGYTVPSTVSYLGGSFYMQNSFLLKYCSLPAAAQGKLELKMREEATYYSYSTDGGNTWDYSTTQPANWSSIDNSYKCSWTYYTYWLENVAYRNSSGINDNDPTAKNTDKGDLDAPNLSEQSFWYWDNGNSKQVKAQVISSTETQPVGFDFKAQSLVTSVKANIESIYASQVPAFNASNLQTLADGIIVMPDTTKFPTY